MECKLASSGRNGRLVVPGYHSPPHTNGELSHGFALLSDDGGETFRMGATVFDDGWPLHPRGVTFRVWAPHAQAVYVGGDFNGWSGTQAALASEGNGNWSLDWFRCPSFTDSPLP